MLLGQLLLASTTNSADQAVQTAGGPTPLDEDDRVFVADHIQRLCAQLERARNKAGKNT